MYKLKAAEWRPQHFKWEVKDRVATISLNHYIARSLLEAGGFRPHLHP